MDQRNNEQIIKPKGLQEMLDDDPTLTEKVTYDEYNKSIEQSQKGVSDDSLEEAYRIYQKLTSEEQIKPKGLQEILDDDPTLTREVTYEEFSNSTEQSQDVDPTVNSLENAKKYLEHSQHYDDSLRKQNDKELLYEKKASKKLYKEALIRTIEKNLPMSYEEFKQLDLNEQQRILEEVKEKKGNIQKDYPQRFGDFITDLEGDTDLHLGLIEEDLEDMKGHNAPKTLSKKFVSNNDIED